MNTHATRRLLPVTVVGGYLGAGKTTFINRLLRTVSGRRFAVIVNDFGELNIDARLLESASDRTLTLSNGCVCCALADDLGETFASLTALANDLDHVLLEASGVANSSRLGSLAETWPGFVLRQIVNIVDASRVQRLVADKFVGAHIRQELVHADRLLVSKTDLLDARQQEAFDAWLRDITAQPTTLLANGHATLGEPELEAVSGMANTTSPTSRQAGAAASHPGFDRRVYTTGECVSRNRIKRWLSSHRHKGYRIKGFVTFADAPGEPHILQFVDDRWSLEATLPAGRPQRPLCEIVAIGLDLSTLDSPFER